MRVKFSQTYKKNNGFIWGRLFSSSFLTKKTKLMRKLLLGGVMILCVSFVYAQHEGVKETVIKGKDETYDDIEYLEKNFGDVKIGEIIMVMPDNTIEKVEEPVVEEVTETAPPEIEKVENSSSSRKVTSPGSSSSSSTRKVSSRKRTKRKKRKKISFKRSRPKRMKRKRKMGNRAVCPRF